MRVFLYEFVSGGGFFHPALDTKPDGSLLSEGLAMWNAAYDDFSRIDDVEVTTTRDCRLSLNGLPSHCEVVDGYDLSQLTKLASECDFCLLIAPEFDGHLCGLALRLRPPVCRLLGPDVRFIITTSSKSTTAKNLAAANVATPPGQLVAIGEAIPRSTTFPAVVKVDDGAGSMAEVVQSWSPKSYDQVMRVEPYLNGTPCSQSFLCRADSAPIPCPPMKQHIAADGSLSYLGGERLDERLATRAGTLARAAMDALFPTIGYVGVDMILGESDDGSDDFVLEVNPRLTTSYLGIRELSEHNLAQAMIDIALGEEPTVSFSSDPVRFDASGKIL